MKTSGLGFFKKLKKVTEPSAQSPSGSGVPQLDLQSPKQDSSDSKKAQPSSTKKALSPYSGLVKAFGKLIPKNMINAELTTKTRENLQKLNDTDTRMNAFKELKVLIMSNNNKSSIEIFLQHFLDNLKSTSPIAKELQVLLVGFCASVANHNFFSMNVNKELRRIISFIIRNTKEGKININKACAVTLVDVWESGMKIKDKTIFERAIGDSIVQTITKYKANSLVVEGICVISMEFISYFLDQNQEEMVIYVVNNWLNPSISTSFDSPYLYKAFDLGLDSLPVDEFEDEIFEILKIACNKVKSLKVTSINEICNLLITLGCKLKDESGKNNYRQSVLELCEKIISDKRFVKKQLANNVKNVWLNADSIEECNHLKNNSNRLDFVRTMKIIAKKKNITIDYNHIKRQIYEKGVSGMMKIVDFAAKNNDIMAVFKGKPKVRDLGRSRLASLRDFKKNARKQNDSSVNADSIVDNRTQKAFYNRFVEKIVVEDHEPTEAKVPSEEAKITQSRHFLSKSFEEPSEIVDKGEELFVDDEMLENELKHVNVFSRVDNKRKSTKKLSRVNRELKPSFFNQQGNESKLNNDTSMRKLEEIKRLNRLGMEGKSPRKKSTKTRMQFKRENNKNANSMYVILSNELQEFIEDNVEDIPQEAPLIVKDRSKAIFSKMLLTHFQNKERNNVTERTFDGFLASAGEIFKVMEIKLEDSLKRIRDLEGKLRKIDKPIEKSEIKQEISIEVINKEIEDKSPFNGLKQVRTSTFTVDNPKIERLDSTLLFEENKEDIAELHSKLKESLSEFDFPKLNSTWSTAKNHLINNNFNEGLRIILDDGDDLNLIRMILSCDPFLDKISFSYSKTLLNRLIQIVYSKEIEQILCKYFKQADDLFLLDAMSFDNRLVLEDLLFEFSQSINSQLSSKGKKLLELLRVDNQRTL